MHNYEFLQFNEANIYNPDQILTWIDIIEKNGSDRLPPIELYTDDDGKVYIIDGHHRTLALITKNIPFAEWERLATDQDGVMGVSFMNWESASNVLERISIKNERGINMNAYEAMPKEQKELLGITESQIEELIKKHMPTKILPQIQQEVFFDSVGNLESAERYIKNNSAGSIIEGKILADPNTDFKLIGEVGCNWKEPVTGETFAVKLALKEKTVIMVDHQGKNHERTQMAAVIIEAPPHKQHLKEIGPVAEARPFVNGKHISVFSELRGQGLGSSIMYLYNQKHKEKGHITTPEGEKMAERYCGIRIAVLKKISEIYNRELPRYYERMHELNRGSEIKEAAREIIDVNRRVFTINGKNIAYDHQKLISDATYAQQRQILNKDSIPSDNELNRMPQRVTTGELLQLLAEKRFCDVLKNKQYVFQENCVDALDSRKSELNKKINTLHNLMLLGINEQKVREPTEDINTYLNKIMKKIPIKPHEFKERELKLKDVDAACQNQKLSLYGQYVNTNGIEYEIKKNESGNVFIAVNKIDNAINAALIKTNEGIRIYKTTDERHIGSDLACLHYYIEAVNPSIQDLSPLTRESNNKINAYFAILQDTITALPEIKKAQDGRRDMPPPEKTRQEPSKDLSDSEFSK